MALRAAVLAWRHWLCASVFYVTSVAVAASLQVAPLRLELNALHPIGAMSIGNNDAAEFAVQAEVLEWSQVDGMDVYKATQDVLVNPTIFRLPGNSRQIVRVGLRVPADALERSYRIFVQQLPRDRPLSSDSAAQESSASLQTLLRIGVPIFIAPVVVTQKVQWHMKSSDSAPSGGDRYVLVMDNQGTQHIQLTRIMVRDEQGHRIAQKSLSQYVLAGQSSIVSVDLPPLAPDAALRIEVQSDAAAALPAAVVRVPRGEATPR